MLVLFGGLVPLVGKKSIHLGHTKESLRKFLRKGKKRYPSTETGDETHTMDAEGND